VTLQSGLLPLLVAQLICDGGFGIPGIDGLSTKANPAEPHQNIALERFRLHCLKPGWGGYFHIQLDFNW
jgi:hypothetical protein